MADSKKIIWRATINGIRGILLLISIQLIFIKNKMMDVMAPAVIIIAAIKSVFFVKFIFGANDFVLLLVFIVGH